MIDPDVQADIDALVELLQPSALKRIELGFMRLYQKIEELTKSRENWKEKYKNLKESIKPTS